MSADGSQPDIVSVACVVESSLALANEWTRTLHEYLSPLIKRLNEASQGSKFRMAFVTYGTSDRRPTSLLAKRFFTDIQMVTKELKEDPSRLGIGQTGSGGVGGMSALEGLVAAVELFDELQSYRPAKEASLSTCHIFHITASPCDEAKYPRWNTLPSLDQTTWQTLPQELKKRNINLSIINLAPVVTPRLSELHTSVVGGQPQKPWFAVKSHHTLLLSGFPNPSNKVKRAPETQPSHQELKRPKLLHTPSSGDIAPKPELQTTAPAANSVQQTNMPPLNAQILAQLPHSQQIVERLRSAEAIIRKLHADIGSALAAGDTATAAALKEQQSKHLLTHSRFKQAINVLLTQHQNSIASRQQTQAQTSEKSQSTTEVDSTTTEINNNIFTNPPTIPQDTLATDPPLHGTHGSGFSMAKPLGLASVPSSSIAQTAHSAAGAVHAQQTTLAVQMQKLLDHQQLQRRPSGGIPTIAQQQGTQADIPSTSMNIASGHVGPPNNTKPKRSVIPVWQGSLTWSGFDPNMQVQRDQHVLITAHPQNNVECHADTWPSTLTLTPAREPLVSLAELQAWMKRHRPALCSFSPQQNGISEPSDNESNFKSLVHMLSVKKLFALAAWTTPTGLQTNNVLVFPVNSLGLVGAFFPMTGIPDMPKSEGTSAIPHSAGIPSALLAHLNKMTPQQRQAALLSLSQAKAQKQAMQAAGAVTPQTSNAGPSSSSIDASMIANPGGIGGGPRPMESGNGQVSFEMLQSFMHRNADASREGS